MSDKEREEEMREPAALLLVLAGLFAMAGGVFDWDWFMNNRKAQALVNLLGRGGARVFYIILGLAIAILGLLITFGVVASGR
jgi:hypothetical protein